MNIFKNTKIFIILFFTLHTIPVTSQVYFPLSIGNSWTYREIGSEHPGQPLIIIDSLRITGDLYFNYGAELETAELICSDSLGNIWKYNNGEKVLWFDFTIAELDSYFYNPDDPIIKYVVRAHKNLSFETKFGILENCIRFEFDDPNIIDEERYYVFAPGLGLIQEESGMGITYLLDSAIIDSKLVTKVLSSDTSIPKEISLKPNYPNPFNLSTTVEFSLHKDTYIKLLLLDIKGQIIKELLNQNIIAGTHSISLDASNIASGQYFVILKANHKIISQKILLLK